MFKTTFKLFFIQRVTKPAAAITLLSCLTGICDDRGLWAGVHHPHLVSRLLLPLQGMAGAPALRPQAFLCYRWAVFLILHDFSCSVVSFSFLFFPYLFWDKLWSRAVPRFCPFQSVECSIFICSLVQMQNSVVLQSLHRFFLVNLCSVKLEMDG